MSVPVTSTATPTPVEQLTGARLFASDVHHVARDARLGFLFADNALEHVAARVFGIPREQQSLLVKILVTAAAARVAGSYVARLPLIRPARADVVLGGSALGAAVRGLAGAPAQSIAGASVLVGVAVVAGSIRAVMAGSTRDAEWLAHEAEARYGHARV